MPMFVSQLALHTTLAFAAMTPTEMSELVVDTHNDVRRAVLATNMRTMQWDDNLAAQAQAYADQCTWAHSGTAGVGENLYLMGTNGQTTERRVLEDGMAAWAAEQVDYIWGQDGGYCNDSVCGHYTQMVWADTDRVGCAVAECAQVDGVSWPYSTSMLVVCQYQSPGNWLGEAPYEISGDCPEDVPLRVDGLCTSDDSSGDNSNLPPVIHGERVEGTMEFATNPFASDDLWTLVSTQVNEHVTQWYVGDPDGDNYDCEAVGGYHISGWYRWEDGRWYIDGTLESDAVEIRCTDEWGAEATKTLPLAIDWYTTTPAF